MSRFDEEPDSDIHGECAAEVAVLTFRTTGPAKRWPSLDAAEIGKPVIPVE